MERIRKKGSLEVVSRPSYRGRANPWDVGIVEMNDEGRVQSFVEKPPRGFKVVVITKRSGIARGYADGQRCRQGAGVQNDSGNHRHKLCS